MEEDKKAQRSSKGKFTSNAILLLIISFCIFYLLTLPSFHIGTVTITGNNILTEDELFNIAQIPKPYNVLNVNVTETEKRLKRDLRVEKVTVTRKMFTEIVINIEERKPICYIACDYGFLQLDKNGVILTAVKNVKKFNLPIITGMVLENLYIGDIVNDVNIKSMLEYLAMLDEATLNKLSEVNISNQDYFLVYTTNSVQIKLGNKERLAEKANLTKTLLQELSSKNMKVEYIDLNYATPFMKFK